MRVCLGMLARSDTSKDPLLEVVLPRLAPSFDGVELLYDEGTPIRDFAARRNMLIRTAEAKGYDWMVMLDSDECMFPEDIAKIRSLMVPPNRFIILPRHEFVRDFEHYEPTPYPDWQGRVFRLGIGYRYRRPVHEGLYRRFSPLSERRWFGGTYSETTPIYHYGQVTSTETMLLKHMNYQRLSRNEAPLMELPDDVDTTEGSWPWGDIKVFEGPHPLQRDAPGPTTC